MLGGADPLRRALVREMGAELAPHVSAVEALGDWNYYQRTTTHLPCYCRRPRAGGPEQVFRPPPTSTLKPALPPLPTMYPRGIDTT